MSPIHSQNTRGINRGVDVAPLPSFPASAVLNKAVLLGSAHTDNWPTSIVMARRPVENGTLSPAPWVNGASITAIPMFIFRIGTLAGVPSGVRPFWG